MDIDVLYDLMKVSSNKKETLLFFLSKTVSDQVRSFNLKTGPEELYLNDTIYCIKKSTLQLDVKGKLVTIDGDKLSVIMYGDRFTVTINASEYYLFVKPLMRKNKQNDRSFYESLLKML
jgi:hypothetical protein